MCSVDHSEVEKSISGKKSRKWKNVVDLGDHLPTIAQLSPNQSAKADQGEIRLTPYHSLCLAPCLSDVWQEKFVILHSIAE